MLVTFCEAGGLFGHSKRTLSWQTKLHRSTRAAAMIAFFAALLFARALAAGNLARADGQPQGERFVCTAVPAGADLSCPVDTDNRVQSASPQEDEFRSTIVQLRETVLQQRETIASQQGTIKELNSKLSRCEAAAHDARDSKWRGGARRKDYGKNTMGDLPRDPVETIEQLGKTMQGLKDRLENLEVRKDAIIVLVGRRCINESVL